MTGSLLTVLHPIPDALFAGVFVVGWDDLEGNGIMAKILYLVRAPRFVRCQVSLRFLPSLADLGQYDHELKYYSTNGITWGDECSEMIDNSSWQSIVNCQVSGAGSF